MASGIDTLIDLPKEMNTNVCTCGKNIQFCLQLYIL